MSGVRFYFDEMMSRRAAEQLTTKGMVVIFAKDVGMTSKDDDTEHLPYAAEQNCVLVTFDRPFAGRTSKRTDHAGLICLLIDKSDVGGIVRTLAEFAETYTQDDAAGQVFWL
jgi:predicted nuclease of predicted toxin-antitoxin system